MFPYRGGRTVVIVTGADSRIGAATARRHRAPPPRAGSAPPGAPVVLAGHRSSWPGTGRPGRAPVVLAGRRENPLREVAAAITAAGGQAPLSAQARSSRCS